MSALWAYVKGKTDSLYSLSGHTHPYYKVYDIGAGKNGYVKVMDIVVKGNYQNQPMIFFFGQRQRYTMTRLSIVLTSQNTAAAVGISRLTVAGDTGMAFYYVKTADVNFSIYAKKSESYDNIVLYGYYKGTYLDSTQITFNAEFVESLPTGYVAATRGENVLDATYTSNLYDNNNGQVISVSYSKSGLDYGNFTWLAAWNGYELRAVNKSAFATAGHDHSFMTNAEIDALF